MKRTKGRKGFYRDLFTLVMPIAIQNIIASAVSLADVVMLGQLNQTALSASSLAGQLQFLLNFIFFGLASSLTILAAQYWGKKDSRVLGKILGMGIIIAMAFSVPCTILTLAAPGAVMRIWTNVPELVEQGSRYLRYAAFSYLFVGLCSPYLALMKSCERVRLSMLVSMITLGLNVVLNAILIFGLLGAPAMGIKGAALATTISRGVGLVICLADFGRQRVISRRIREIFSIPGTLVQDFIKYSLPAFINDAMWGLAFNMNSIIMGHLGSDIVAANSVMTVARDLVTTVGFGISDAASILLGKEIGEKRMEEARSDAAAILRTTFITGLISGTVLLAISPAVPHFAKLSETAVGYLRVMLLVSVVYQMGQLINTVLIASILRCGGDSRYGMILDILTMWAYLVPLGLISAFVLKLPPMVVFLLMCTDEFVKMPFALHHYRSGRWLKNLTREHPHAH